MIFIGVFKNTNDWIYQRAFDRMPYEALNDSLNHVLNKIDVSIYDIDRIYLPCNPGSKLGIRLTSMLAQTLNSIIHGNIHIKYYNGLYLTALVLGDLSKDNAWLITENGRNLWNAIEINSELQDKPIIHCFDHETITNFNNIVYYLPQIKNWDAPSVTFKQVAYQPELFLQFIDLIKSSKVDQCMLQKSSHSYIKWEKPLNQL